jgi:hypothetical protein
MVLAVSRSNGLDAEVRKNEHHGLVMLAGELDAATAGRLFDTLAELAREGSSTSPSTSLNSISSTPPVSRCWWPSTRERSQWGES